MKSFTLDSLQGRFGIRRAIVSELVKSGFVKPGRGDRREYRFSFHDLVLLRMAQDLHSAGVSPRKFSRFLKDLSQSLPDRPAAGMRFTTAGRELVVRQDGSLRNQQGQLVLDFSASAEPARVTRLKRRAGSHPAPAHDPQPASSAPPDAQEHFALAEQLVDVDAAAAAAHYRQCAELDPSMLDAWINLSCVLLDAGQAIEAYACCQEGLLHHPRSALLHYNLGLAQEEMQQAAEALASYEEALRCDPQLHDAHHNAAELAEQLGRHKLAIRHYNAWRRAQG